MIKRNPLVTIIVPVYNREKTILTCLQSIKKLHYQNYEVLVIDDGSSDNSLKLVRQCVENDSRFRVLTQKNSGVSVARNNCLKQAKGEWITFVDSDDAVLPWHLDIVCFEDKSLPDLLMTGHCFQKTYDLAVEDNLGERGNLRTEHTDAANYLFSVFDPYKNPLYPVWNKFFRNELLKTHNIRFNETMSLGEDLEFVCHYLQYCSKIVAHTKPSYINIGWESLVHLGSTLREPIDYLHNQKLVYDSLCKLALSKNQHKDKMGGGIYAYACHFAIDRPITRILLNYTKLENQKIFSKENLLAFTTSEIVPFLKSIQYVDSTKLNWEVKLIYSLLMHDQCKMALNLCEVINHMASFKKIVKGTIKRSLKINRRKKY